MKDKFTSVKIFIKLKIKSDHLSLEIEH